MKVQLIVVRGKPEGKVIPLTGSKFKIGRGETCHLRPNSEQVSREHAEFSIVDGVVSVADLGSRNGTLVNGKALTEACVLKDGNLVQVGPLTFAVQITDAPVPAPAASKPAPAKPAAPAAPPTKAPPPKAPAAHAARSAPEDVLNEDIDAWLVGEGAGNGGDVSTNVYGGETITIAAFKDAAETASASPPPPAPAVEEDEEEEVEEEKEEAVEDSLEEEEEADEEDDEEDDEAEGESMEDFVDESNPFYAAKKAQKDAEKSAKAGPAAGGGAGPNQQFKDTSDAASEILRKLMEKRRSSK